MFLLVDWLASMKFAGDVIKSWFWSKILDDISECEKRVDKIIKDNGVVILAKK